MSIWADLRMVVLTAWSLACHPVRELRALRAAIRDALNR